MARSTRATTVTSSSSTRLDRSVSLPGSKYRRGTKSSRSPTVWRLRYFARGLAVGLPTTWPSGVDRSATSLHPQQQRIGRLTTIDAVSYTHLRAHETPEHIVCRLLLE